jgi:hypothetical protein
MNPTSTLTQNGADSSGGLANRGTADIQNTTFSDNLAFGSGGLSNSGTLTLTNSTVARNHAVAFGGGGISNSGTLTITNSTLSENTHGSLAGAGGGIFNSGTVELHNTILARNTSGSGPSTSPDCSGSLTSRGHNLIGDTTGCTIALHASDLMGDPGLDAFTDDPTPGVGHFPLLATSPAIDAGNDAGCPPTDQLGQPRIRVHPSSPGVCDIGAIEFQPPAALVN